MALEDSVPDLIGEPVFDGVDQPLEAGPTLYALDAGGWNDAEPLALTASADPASETSGTEDVLNDPFYFGRDVVDPVPAVDQTPYPVRYSGLADGADPTVLRGPLAGADDSSGDGAIVQTLGASGPPNRPIDLIDTRRSLGGESVSVGASLTRSAAYDARLQFYEVLDSHCSVRDPFTGRRLLPADPGYREAALSPAHLLSGPGQSLQVNDQSERFVAFNVSAGRLLAPVLILANGDTWFSPAAANRDGFAHFRSLGGGAYGVEDGAFGGDRDFDDLRFQFALATPSP